MEDYRLCLIRIQLIDDDWQAIEQALDHTPWQSDLWPTFERILENGREFDRADFCAAVRELMDAGLHSAAAAVFESIDQRSQELAQINSDRPEPTLEDIGEATGRLLEVAGLMSTGMRSDPEPPPPPPDPDVGGKGFETGGPGDEDPGDTGATNGGSENGGHEEWETANGGSGGRVPRNGGSGEEEEYEEAVPPAEEEEIETTAAGYVNLTFSDQTMEWAPRELELQEGFEAERSYGVAVAIGREADIRYMPDGEQPQIERPDVEVEYIDLTVAIFAEPEEVLAIVGSPLGTLRWPKNAPSTRNAEFLLEVAAVTAPVSGRLDIYFYYESNLIYTAGTFIHIQPKGQAWPQDGRPITWAYQADEDRGRSLLFQRFAYLNQLTPRGVNLAIQAGRSAEEFKLTAFMGRAELPARVRITRAELNGQLVQMRAAMDMLRKEPYYIDGAGYDAAGEYTADLLSNDGAHGQFGQSLSKVKRQKIQKRYQAFLEEMAYLGSQFWDRLFGRTDSGRLLRQAIEQHLQDGDIIQVWIDREATDFVYPWSWLYGKTIEPGDEADKDRFWGYRYVIEQLPQYEETARKPPPTPVLAVDELDIKMGAYDFPQLTGRQVDYLSGKSKEAYSDRFDVWGSDEQWQDYLEHCASHILYFYAHGHTAKPASLAGQQFYDMVAGQKAWLSEISPDEPDWMTAYRLQAQKYLSGLEQDPQRVEENYILLDDGYLMQREMQEMDLWATRPLVFLNMCESAQVFPDISEGMIDLFLKKGARAVIGTEIPMLARFADLFAREFFDLVLTPPRPTSTGQALLELRRRHLDRGNPLAFAYTLYGDATTRLEWSN